jgi:acyl-CoA thioester hydrolase
VSGAVPGTPFRLAARVYYEDTDAAGVVYYANYLRYMERARTEWLAALGFDLAALESGQGVVFAVHRVDIEYLAPARLGDRIEVTVALEQLGRARMIALQEVRREAQTLTRARVVIACLDRSRWLPARLPATVRARMEGAL